MGKPIGGADVGRAGRPLSTAAVPSHIAWVDGVKALALLWIIWEHWTERVFGYAMFANPHNAWPPFAERIDQLYPLSGFGIWDWPLSVLRVVGWMGDAGVQLFLIASGFALAWGALRHAGAPRWLEFYRRRFVRIYPTWIVAHLGLLVIGLVMADPGLKPTNVDWWLSLVGFRAIPGLIYAFCPAWWFVGLILQLYAVYPLLHILLVRMGWVRFAVVVIGLSVAIRGIGLWLFAGPLADWHYLDAWSRGAVFVTRLPEFAAGMALAAAYRAAPREVEGWLRARPTLALAACVTAIGFALSFFLLGNAVSTALFGCGAFILAGVVARPLLTIGAGRVALMWVAKHSLSLFLTHQLAILLLVPNRPVFDWAMAVRTAAALAFGVAAAMALEFIVFAGGWLFSSAQGRWGARGAWVRVGAAAVAVYAVLLSGELLSRRYDHDEIAGWGERPALAPHPDFGWTLIPSQTTRLRWQTYDYVVQANALGFPAPAYGAEKPAGTLRIFTVGDAFTSAEGVNTADAWPRQLEHDLAGQRPGRLVQVMNFAITGYGPNQEAAVLDRFVPVYHPDVIIVALFVNDLDDAVTSNEAFQHSIGFGQPAPEGLFATLALGNLHQLATVAIRSVLFEKLLGRPSPRDGFLAMLDVFQKAPPTERDAQERSAVEHAFRRMERVAATNHSRLIALLVPAGIQVCSAEQLPYAPRNVDLSDTGRFDMERPQRTLSAITTALGIETEDLRTVLKTAAGGCPYQPRNLHWRENGHVAVAAFVADLLAHDGALAAAH